MAIHNFRRMEVWKNAMELTKSIYNMLVEIPNDERFGLKSQISRCSVSIPSNIAEGSGRSTDKDFFTFFKHFPWFMLRIGNSINTSSRNI